MSENQKIIAYYPPFRTDHDFTDHYYRLLWYLNPIIHEVGSIVIPYLGEKPVIGNIPSYLDQDIRLLEANFESRLHFVSLDENPLAHLEWYEQSEVIVKWKSTPSASEPQVDSAIDETLRAKQVWRVDHLVEQYASSFYLKLSSEWGDGQQQILAECQSKFQQLSQTDFRPTGAIMGTGPNLSQVADFDFSNSTNIACNSMVKNVELMHRLTPPIIVISDPIFHAGCSSYAGEFRRHLQWALEEFNSFLIVPMRDYRLYMANLDRKFQSQIIGVPLKSEPNPNLDLRSDFYVSTTSNVMTLFLLPLACTFFSDIYLAGFDGRPLQENDYFWKHDPKSQLTNRMEDIQLAHPAFFQIDYDDYYETHCQTVEAWLGFGESRGKRFLNLTPSYIPALSKRRVDKPDTVQALTPLYQESDNAQLDEIRLVAQILLQNSEASVLMDIGAQSGAATKRFAQAGWKVIAFESDRAAIQSIVTQLQEALASAQNNISLLEVDARVEISTSEHGDQPQIVIHHQPVDMLPHIIEKTGIKGVDCLRLGSKVPIDQILANFAWDELVPKAILCEVNQLQATQKGYDIHHIARILMNQNYRVFVSEWRGGNQQRYWHQIVEYPITSVDAETSIVIVALQPAPDVFEIKSRAMQIVAEQPIVSIIMPVKNGEETIEQAVQSIQKQNFQNWELVVVDDTSTDRTISIVQRLRYHDRRVRLLQNPGAGVSAARNHGLDEARGQYIAFLDADDTYLHRALELRVEALDKYPAWTAVFCEVEVTDEKLRPLNWQLGKKQRITFKDFYGNPLHINGVMVRQKQLVDVRFDTTLANGEDWLFLSQIARSGTVFHKVHGCSATYRQHTQSTVRQDFVQHEQALVHVIDLIFGQDPACPNPAPEYAKGLGKVRIPEIIVERRVGLLTSLLLLNEIDMLTDILPGSSTLAWDRLNSDRIANGIKYSTIRVLMCQSNRWKAALRQRQDSLIDTINRVNLTSALPFYTNTLLELVGIPKEKIDTSLMPRRVLGNMIWSIRARIPASIRKFTHLDRLSQRLKGSQRGSIIITLLEKMEGLWPGLFLTSLLAGYSVLDMPIARFVAFVAWIPLFLLWVMRAKRRWSDLMEHLINQRNGAKHRLSKAQTKVRDLEKELQKAKAHISELEAQLVTNHPSPLEHDPYVRNDSQSARHHKQ